MDDELLKLDREIGDRYRALRDIEREMNDEISAARLAISKKFEDRASEARLKLHEAHRAKAEYIDQNSSHPWDGKRVYRMRKQYRWGREAGEVREEGIVEVVRRTSQFRANLRYAIPNAGTVIVRKVKKDGTPSLEFYSSYSGTVEKIWTLCEDQPGETK